MRKVLPCLRGGEERKSFSIFQFCSCPLLIINDQSLIWKWGLWITASRDEGQACGYDKDLRLLRGPLRYLIVENHFVRTRSHWGWGGGGNNYTANFSSKLCIGRDISDNKIKM